MYYAFWGNGTQARKNQGQMKEHHSENTINVIVQLIIQPHFLFLTYKFYKKKIFII